MMKVAQQQSQQQQTQQQQSSSTSSQFEITSISCKTGNNENEEKSTRFRRVKIDNNNSEITANNNSPYTRGRWKIIDYIDDTKKDSTTTQNDSTQNEILISATKTNVSQKNGPTTNKDKQMLNINTNFEPLTTTTTSALVTALNNELMNQFSPPSVKQSPPLYVPTPTMKPQNDQINPPNVVNNVNIGSTNSLFLQQKSETSNQLNITMPNQIQYQKQSPKDLLLNNNNNNLLVVNQLQNAMINNVQAVFQQQSSSSSLLSTATPQFGLINDYFIQTSTKTSSSSSSSNDLLNIEASLRQEVFIKKPHQDGENEKKNDDAAGIHSRIELAMDLVKKHLTTAVKDEIQYLRTQINNLNEKCARLEDENRILKQHATTEVLMLINDRSSSSQQITPIQQQQHQQQQQQQQLLSTNFSKSSSTTSSTNPSTNITQAMLFSPSALSATDVNLNMSSSGDDNETPNSSNNSSTNVNENNSNNNNNNNSSIEDIKIEEKTS